ncbi:MAG: hypothetical protein ACREMO_09260 [Gemmatimonadales bacterium]
MSWWAIDVRPAPERRAWLSAWLVTRTGQAVEERDDGTLITFAEDEPAADALLAEIRGACERVEAARRPPADLILSNILRLANAALLPAIAGALRPGGAAILAGMEEAEAAELGPVLAAAEFTIVDQAVGDGCWAVSARRP